MIDRRAFVAGTFGAMLPMEMAAATAPYIPLFGLIGRMSAHEGKRAELVGILLEGTRGMPGCISYIVAIDPADDEAIWITEIWDSRESHAASLQLPAVQDAIRRARPLIASFDSQQQTLPVGGTGLPA